MTRRGLRGMTLIELVVAMTVGLILLAAATPFVLSGGRSNEQQSATRQVQLGMHIAAETLLAGLRGAHEVLAGSTGTRLELVSPPLSVPCGGDSIWVVTSAAGLGCGPLGGARARILAAEVSQIELNYGVDSDEDGQPEFFTETPDAGQFADVIAVRFRLQVRLTEGRGASEATPEFVGVLRRQVLHRITLAN